MGCTVDRRPRRRPKGRQQTRHSRGIRCYDQPGLYLHRVVERNHFIWIDRGSYLAGWLAAFEWALCQRWLRCVPDGYCISYHGERSRSPKGSRVMVVRIYLQKWQMSGRDFEAKECIDPCH